MRSDTLFQQHPPTPPTGVEGQSGLQHLSQYNAGPRYSFDSVGYSSPGVRVHEGIPSYASRADSHQGEEFGLGIHYEGYGPATEYFNNGQYNGISHTMFAPLTPRSATEDDAGTRRTRSRRATVPLRSPQRKAASPRPKATPKTRKTKATKSDKAKTPKLTAPLSILTRELHHIPVKDMEGWVNRPADVRRREVEKRNGYITRPMNSFMLYRSAYAERAKSWCLQNNHQIVSSVAGESWPLEPQEVRDMFNNFAKTERLNHHSAHPTYKFSPSKAAAPPRKRKSEWSDDDEPSDLDDGEWAPGSGRSRFRHARRFDQSISYPTNGVNVGFFEQSFGPNSHGMNRSSWDMTNEGRPMPLPIQTDVYGQYLQTSAYPSLNINQNFSEDSHMRRVSSLVSPTQFSSNQGLLGLPGGNANDLLQPMGTSFEEGQMDPILLTYDVGNLADINSGAVQHHGWRAGYANMFDEKLEQRSFDNLLDLTPTRSEFPSGCWQSDPAMVSLEQESEFDKWMGER
ncbi:HMG box protein [Dothidotthia symphoricarpi CBS 119687]|uniref:HMG box protein n=1 Tax=Dothidotthia symphoricarpi CBS 119687 TaxID=1392245 RepID=A0A6A6AK34_9PLEO|nr:HMG box protein [Dothidotthia symphoricarpi CBS 119687]KAF2131468.1 HMG box protein [Dothidotthia symphoricarpi CBS 119687]